VHALVRFGSDKNRRPKSAFRIICDLLNLEQVPDAVELHPELAELATNIE
jgi:hypothetical protein